MKKGQFIISLDFELHWGGAEKWDLSKKEEYFNTTRKSIPQVLELFKKYSINATWATVGFLFAKNKEQLLNFSPNLKPTYSNKELSYYSFIKDVVKDNEKEDPYHYAVSLIKKIVATPGQELATHTFAHYYCNEKGQTIAQFEADLRAAQNISKENFGITLKSLVFPRNQFNPEYIEVAKKNGIKVVRSNPNVWFWKKINKFSPIARAVDTLFSISKPLSYNLKKGKEEILLLPASRFLRAYSKKEKSLQKLKSNRVKKEMLHAAKNNKVYHLWWHPHNFGYSSQENLIFLEEILQEYKKLNKKYGFQSSTMIEMYK